LYLWLISSIAASASAGKYNIVSVGYGIVSVEAEDGDASLAIILIYKGLI
jgi:hypothetical protein